MSIIIGLPAVVAFALISADSGAKATLPAGTEPPPAAAPAAYPEVTLDFQDVPLEDVAAQLAVLSGMRIVVDPAVVDAPAVTLKVDGMRLDNVLTFITSMGGTAWQRGDDGTITIGKATD